jgi:lysine-specific histone demethylase 1
MLIGPIEVPTPLILPRDSVLLRKRKEPTKDPRRAKLEAYEQELLSHIHSKLGERPVRPNKVAANAYILYSKALFDVARKKCEENRKPGKAGRAVPNEVRIMTSKMWKEATPEERKPYEDQAMEQRRGHADAVQAWSRDVEKWDREAASLRAEYQRDHPPVPGLGELARESSHKHRRARVSYAEDRDSEGEI